MSPRPIHFLAIAPTGRGGRAFDLQCAHIRRLGVKHNHTAAKPPPISSSHTPLWKYKHTTCFPTTSISPYRTIRHASTTLPKKKLTTASAYRPSPNVPTKTAQPSTILPHTQWNPKLNPPSETYAPPLEVPARRPDQSYASWLWGAGRTYIQFYKTGIKRVRSTAKLAKTWRTAMKEASAKSPSTSPSGQEGSSILSPRESAITRAQWQVILRSRKDMLRLPVFGILLLVMGEWLPFLVIWLTPVVPESCRIPAQVEREQTKKETRRRERERRLALDAHRLLARDRKVGTGQAAQAIPSPQAVQLDDVKRLDLLSLLTLSTKLDTHSKFWDFLFITPPKGVLRWGLQRQLSYLHKDDALIQRDGGWQGLGKEEVQRACVERGFDVLGKSEGDMRKALAGWYARK